MPANDQTARSLQARAAIYTRWSRVADRKAATEPARRAAWAKWEAQVDPDGVLDPETRRVMAEAARRAHMLRMAARSRTARRERRDG